MRQFFFMQEGVKSLCRGDDVKPCSFPVFCRDQSINLREKNGNIFKVLICKGVKLCYYNKDYVILLVKANTAWRM